VLFSEENTERVRNSFLGFPDVDMDKSESEIEKVVEELEGLAGLEALDELGVYFLEKELSRESVRSVNYHGSGSAFVTAVALASRNSVDESDGSSSGVDEPQVRHFILAPSLVFRRFLTLKLNQKSAKNHWILSRKRFFFQIRNQKATKNQFSRQKKSKKNSSRK
jgi:hypothetical protein